MLTWIVLAGGIAIMLTLTLFGLIHLRRRLVLHTETLTPYTDQHARELEWRLERLARESREQTSTLQESLESLRAGRRHRER
jgi:hypothetical protein